MVALKGPLGPSPSPYWDVCWHSPTPPCWQPASWGAQGRGRWNVKSKMQIHADKRCRKHVLCDSGNLDISQSQMNMSANTVGQLLGYLKRRFGERASVTSEAAGTVYVKLSGQGLPLLWPLSSFSSLPLSVSQRRLLEWDTMRVGRYRKHTLVRISSSLRHCCAVIHKERCWTQLVCYLSPALSSQKHCVAHSLSFD